jgi:hypothetical protein
MLGMIILYEKKLLRKKRKIPNRKLEWMWPWSNGTSQ